jgi:hypothetical protein
MRLFGKTWTREALLKHAGSVRQIGGAQPVVLDDGPERGVRAIDVRTGSGFRFTVLPDRGMDVWQAEHNGRSLCWHSPTGPIAPAFFEPGGLGWLRGFQGGLLVTCGLTYCGGPNKDQGQELGLHGRASYLPAYEVGVSEGWEGDEYRIEIRGKIREASVFGEHLALSRRIRTALGENRFTLEDEVENLGHEPSPLMVLYHVNGGFPVLDETSELLSASIEARPADAEAEKEKDSFNRFLPPTAGFAERCYFHTLKAGRDGRTAVALVNRARGLGYALRYPVAQMPCFTEWKMMGQGIYVCGTEPGNVNPAPRERLRREGALPFLKPGEKRRFELEFSALTSAEDILAVESEIRGL